MLTDDYQFPDGVHAGRNVEESGPEPTPGNMEVLRQEINRLNRCFDLLNGQIGDLDDAFKVMRNENTNETKI